MSTSSLITHKTPALSSTKREQNHHVNYPKNSNQVEEIDPTDIDEVDENHTNIPQQEKYATTNQNEEKHPKENEFKSFTELSKYN